MSAIEKLGSSLFEALRKLVRSPVIDEATVKELTRDVQRALLQADVNVQLVLDITKNIERRSLEEKLPPGIPRREHIVKVVYEELTKFLGEKPAKIGIKTGRLNVLMLVGIQGSGKTTTAAKLARYFQKRGFKSALICADTHRPGAYAQLKQLADSIGVPIYREKGGNSLDIALHGIEKFRKDGYDVVLIDTAGRHKDEKSLIKEMKELGDAIKPDDIILVIDGTIGQQAAVQAKAFHKATRIGSIFIAKLDGSARGGGALSAVAATGAPIKFIGTGEKIDELEQFVPARFVGRLLGMGDIEGLIEKVKSAEAIVPEKKAQTILRGKFTLTDMLEQLEAMQRLGPLSGILSRIPGLGYNIPKKFVELAEEKSKKWRFIIHSMTKEERENPKILNASRIRRIARGSGTSEQEIKEMVKQFFLTKKLIKSLKRRDLHFFKKFERRIS